MGSKKIIFTIIFLWLMTIVFSYGVNHHEIIVKIDADGNTQIEEKFYFYFSDENDKSALRSKSTDFGSNLEKWREIDSRFKPHIGSKNIRALKIAYNEGEKTFLELSYSLSESLVAKIKETNRKKEFELKATLLDVDYFYSSGLWIIPENTTIVFELPPNSEIIDKIEPKATIYTKGSRQIVTWDGYKSANKIQFKYAVWTQIATPININEIANYFLKTEQGQLTILIVVIIILIIFAKRKYISEKIEDFVIKNSKL